MMRKVLLLGMLLWLPLAAQAADLGFYFEGGWGYGEIDHNDTDFDTDVRARNYSGGFTLTTNTTTTSRAPSYKLRVGYDQLLLKDAYDVTIESNGFRIDNGLGMPLFKRDGLRVTLGPLLRIGYYAGKSDGTINNTFAKTWVTSVGAGPELNLNLRISEDLAVALDFGYMFNFFAGRIKGNYPSDDYHGHRYNYYTGISLLF